MGMAFAQKAGCDMGNRSPRESAGCGVRCEHIDLFGIEPDVLEGLHSRFVELRDGMIAALYGGNGREEIHADLLNSSPYVHFTCLLRDSSLAQVRGTVLSPGIGEGYVVFAPGERFSVDYGPNYSHVDLMVTPEALAELAGEEFDRIEDEIDSGFVMRPIHSGLKTVDAALRLVGHIEDANCQRLYLHAAALEFLGAHFSGLAAAGQGEVIPLRERQRLVAARER